MRLGRISWRGMSFEPSADWQFSRESGSKENGSMKFSSDDLGALEFKWKPPMSHDKTNSMARIVSNYAFGLRHVVKKVQPTAFSTKISGHEARLMSWSKEKPILASLLWRCVDDGRDHVVEVRPAPSLTEERVISELSALAKTISCHIGDQWGFGFRLNVPGFKLGGMMLTDQRGALNLRNDQGGLTMSWWGDASVFPWREEHLESEVLTAFSGASNVVRKDEEFSGHAATACRFDFDVRGALFSKVPGRGITYLWECPKNDRRYALTASAPEKAMQGLMEPIAGQVLCH